MDGDKTSQRSDGDTNWQFKTDDNLTPEVYAGDIESTPQPQMQSNDQTISWKANEFLYHPKSTRWYLMVVVGALVLAALIYLVTKDKLSTGAMLVVAAIFIYYAARHPRKLDYAVRRGTIAVGPKDYSLSHYKSYYVITEGQYCSLTFIPFKRFALPLNIYFDAADGAKITSLLNQYLPMEVRRLDAVDNLMRKMRF